MGSTVFSISMTYTKGRCDNTSPRSIRSLIVFACVHKSVNEARECTEFAVKSLNTDEEKKWRQNKAMMQFDLEVFFFRGR